jgi:hypothetical protein
MFKLLIFDGNMLRSKLAKELLVIPTAQFTSCFSLIFYDQKSRLKNLAPLAEKNLEPYRSAGGEGVGLELARTNRAWEPLVIYLYRH